MLVACHPGKDLYTQSDQLYKKSNSALNAHYAFYHVSDAESRLYYTISNESLVYKKTDTSAYFYSLLRLEYALFGEGSSKGQPDTGTAYLSDRQTDVAVHDLEGFMLVPANPARTTQSFALIIYDVNKKIKYFEQFNFNKTNNYNRQNFLLTDTYGKVLYSPIFAPGKAVVLKSERNRSQDFVVDYYYRDFPLPLPPFSLTERPAFDYRADSVFKIHAAGDGAFGLNLPSKGFYHIKTNANTREGVTLFTFPASFPNLSSTEEMIRATRYIMTRGEFEHCLNAPDHKAAIDQFWVNLSGNNDRAKELIRRYYNRVTEANRLFTSYVEGWKTDRGLIYIVFGPPGSVYKNTEGEVWIYGESTNPNALKFSFTHSENPFSEQDLILERNLYLKDPWYRAVDVWRQGRVAGD